MALIPNPLDKLITIATRLPKVIEFAKTSATVKDGNLGILVAGGGVVASKKIAKANLRNLSIKAKLKNVWKQLSN